MAELNLKQIIDRLNAEFTGDTRKLVFWYDDKGEFAEDMDSVVLYNAKIYRLERDNQFYTKRFLERVDTTTNYLIYAPFPKPDVKENHLEDTLLYSRRFFADRASLLSVDLGIEEKYKPIIEKHIKFFANKDRTQRFYDLEIENFNEENILVGMLACICRTRTCSFEEVVRVILTEGELQDNKFLTEIEKFDLLSAFWKLCEQHFGYTNPKPNLEKLLAVMFVTATERQLAGDVPQEWKSFVSYKSGNIIAFLDNLSNSVLYRDRYDELSEHVAAGLHAGSILQGYSPESLLDCDTFLVADNIIVKWIMDRLTAEDTGAKLENYDIPGICDKRMKMHFGRRTDKTYQLLESAFHLIEVSKYVPSEGFGTIIDCYRKSDYRIDQQYRKFYFYFDQMEETGGLESLRTLVENIYTNEYLAKLLPKWNEAIQEEHALIQIPLQRDFYRRHVGNAKERTVVIISDAMRYEVGQELLRRMQDDPKCSAKMDVQLSVLPSYTRLGMAAMLPHKALTMTDDYRVLADGTLCDSLAGRQTVLQSYVPNVVCVQFDDIKGLKKNELRDIFTGKQVVYVYHNQIDARGDKANTEDEVFVACEEAIREIIALIGKINTNANTHRFVVTADHGFIYKRDKLTESDKIGGVSGKDAFINRRFIVAQEPVLDEGIDFMPMSMILGNDDTKVVSYPVSSNVFKVAGGGQNFVHGGSSPEEMLVPVVEVKMEKGKAETTSAQIMLVSLVHKITNLITTLDFIQTEPVSDVVKPATYKVCFIDDKGQTISNEAMIVADKRDTDSAKRVFRLKFTFKNQKYDRNALYYLVAIDTVSGMEAFRHSITMDLAFADDFGFGL